MEKEREEQDTLHLYKSIINAQEAERLKLGTILHEQVAQELYAIRVSLQKYLLDHGRIDQIVEIKQMLNTTISEVQQIANHLLPTVLRDFGFMKSIDDLLIQNRNKKIKFTFVSDPKIETLPISLQFHLYRIIQTFVNNAATFAEANTIQMKIKMVKSHVELEVIDYQKVCDYLVAFENMETFGSLKNTIQFYEGSLSIQSNSFGTKIRINLKTVL